jgi:hypothetical protein
MLNIPLPDGYINLKNYILTQGYIKNNIPTQHWFLSLVQVLTVCTWNQRVKVGYTSVAGSWISASSGQGYRLGSRVQGVLV